MPCLPRPTSILNSGQQESTNRRLPHSTGTDMKLQAGEATPWESLGVTEGVSMSSLKSLARCFPYTNALESSQRLFQHHCPVFLLCPKPEKTKILKYVVPMEMGILLILTLWLYELAFFFSFFFLTTLFCVFLGLQHEGIFRVSGSQVEVNDIKNAFERGEVGLNSRKIRQMFQPCGDGSTFPPRVPVLKNLRDCLFSLYFQ